MYENKNISEIEIEYNNVLNKKFNIEHSLRERMYKVMKNNPQEFLDKLKMLRFIHNYKIDKITKDGIFLKNQTDESIVSYPHPNHLDIKDVITFLKEVERLRIKSANERQLAFFK